MMICVSVMPSAARTGSARASNVAAATELNANFLKVLPFMVCLSNDLIVIKSGPSNLS